MLRLALALSPWLLFQGCTGFLVVSSRTTHELQGDDMPTLGLWDPVVQLALACLIGGLIAGVGGVLPHARDLVQPFRALLRTYRSVLPWVLAAAALTFFILSGLAQAEGDRTYWRVWCESYEDSVPAELDQAGPFEGGWVELSKLSYSLYLGYLACFSAWILARIWIARRILRSLDSDLDFAREPYIAGDPVFWRRCASKKPRAEPK